VAENEDSDGKVNIDDSNYWHWTWKQIETAILGGYGQSNTDAAAAQLRNSNPQSLLKAAAQFDGARTVLEKFVGDARSWAASTVGPHGSWTGLGAKGFATMVQNIIDAADSLHAALVATPTYYTTLADAATELQTAITTIQWVDHWGAEATITRYYTQLKQDMWLLIKSALTHTPPQPPWTKLPDGTVIVAVSTYPDIVEDMNNQMRTAIQKLADGYRRYIGQLRNPDAADIEPPQPDTNGQPKLTLPKLTTPMMATPKLPGAGDPGNLRALGAGTGNLPDAANLDSALTPQGLPPLGSGGTDPLLKELTSQGPKFPPLSRIDPSTHLADLTSPKLSPLSDGLRLPGADGAPNAALRSFPLDRPGTPGGGLASPGGLNPYGLPGKFANLAAGGGLAAGMAAEKALADRAAAPAGMGGMGGMPYLPPPMAGRNGKEERERDTWLQEDEDVWGANPDVGPALLGADLEDY
jgi:hypothetical protein